MAASPTVTETTTGPVDPELAALAQTLRSHAESLRAQSAELDPVLATTFRRRASELELESWVAELQSGIPYSELHALAA